jgi:selenide,water dikinase
VGFETGDDAGVYLLDDERAIVVTADFITPILDDPRAFGSVAAANSLSDVYAMGGRPLTAVNLCGYPPAELPPAVLQEILAGAAAKCFEAGVAVAGGHTVRDAEVKFGLAVTGVVHPARIVRNATARPGDALILTKPLGTGALATAHRAGRLPPESDGYRALVETMSALNRPGLVLHEQGASAATDVTGFGLTGHALGMARGAGVTFEFETARLPLLPGAVALCASGHTCGGTLANRAHTNPHVKYDPRLDDGTLGLLNDPQTSGGLLVAVPADRAAAMADALLSAGAICAATIGRAIEHAAGDPHLVFHG